MTVNQVRRDRLTLADTVARVVVLGDPHGDHAGLDAVLAREDRIGTAFISVGDNVGYSDGAASSVLCRRLIERGIPSVLGNHEAMMDEGGRLAIVADRAAPRQVTPEAFAWCRSLPLRLRVEHPDLRLAVAVVHALVVSDAGAPVAWDLPTKDQTSQVKLVSDTKGPLWDFVTSANADIVADAEQADIVFVGHSHGPAIYVIAPDGAITTKRLDLAAGESVQIRAKRGYRYVIDAGSLGRPGHHPEPARLDLATYATLDMRTTALGLHAITKGR